jgi:ParB-like chromosome segregation protein Spo0J
MGKAIDDILKLINTLPEDGKIEAINRVKLSMHEVSPHKNEPVDCVIWVRNETVVANDYNPNTVAPPEMELLQVSIENDGFTQPIVTFDEKDKLTVIDGFHRNRVGKECSIIVNRLKGYLPVTIIREDRERRGDRIASTIRHNRARGKHQVSAMSEIVIELKRRNWSDKKIGKQLGMDPDEILRLCQITGLAEMFSNHEFNEAWEIDDLDDLDIIEEIINKEPANVNL